MADPISWGLIIGGGARALGSIMEGNSQAGQYKAEAAFEKQNALNLTAQAQQIGAAGARDEEAARREYRAFAGGQAATISESNLGMEGSALDIVRDSETAANLDALLARHATARPRRVHDLHWPGKWRVVRGSAVTSGRPGRSPGRWAL